MLSYYCPVNILRKNSTNKVYTYTYVFITCTADNHLTLYNALWFENGLIHIISFDGFLKFPFHITFLRQQRLREFHIQ